MSQETQSYGLPKGASVQAITPESPAATAGLQVNDIITHVDDKEITGSSDLVAIIRECEIGQSLNLKVYRQGNTLDMTLTVGENIQQGIQQETQEQQSVPSQGTSPFPFFNWGY